MVTAPFNVLKREMLKNENENLKKKICFSTSNWMVDFYWNIKGLLVTVKFKALLLALPILYLGETLVWLVDFLQEVEKLHTFCKASLGVKEWFNASKFFKELDLNWKILHT